MDIALLGSKSLKLKSKKTTLVVNPTADISKTEAEGLLLLGDYGEKNISKVEGYRIVISGPGEYEVGGTKISAIKSGDKLAYLVDLDNVKVLIGEGKSIENSYDKIDNCNILVVNADNEFDYTALSKAEPNAILIYGDKKDDVAKSLGKDSPEKINKFSTTLEKLPEDLQVYLLG